MRAALIVATLCLVVGIATWNVVFDRAIQSAEQRYLALQGRHAGVTIRQVMDPAIHDAAADAWAWAAILTGATFVAAAGVAVGTRRR